MRRYQYITIKPETRPKFKDWGGGSRHEQSLTRTDYKVVGTWRGQVADKDEGGDYWREGEGKGPDPGPSPSEENVRQHQRARMLLLAGVHMIADLINTPILIKRGPTSCSHVQIISRRNMKWEDQRDQSCHFRECLCLRWCGPCGEPYFMTPTNPTCTYPILMKRVSFIMLWKMNFKGFLRKHFFLFEKKKVYFIYLMSLHNEL